MPIGTFRTWVKYIEKGEYPDTRRFFSVLRCNQCEDAPCITICPVTALFRRDNGIVDFDGGRCIGCKACMQACPYDALYINPNTNTAEKCNYCAHRVELQLEPACVIVCPVQAIVSGDMNDPASRISRLIASEQTQVRKPEAGTKPKVFYVEADQAALVPTDQTHAAGYYVGRAANGRGVSRRASPGRGRRAGQDDLRCGARKAVGLESLRLPLDEIGFRRGFYRGRAGIGIRLRPSTPLAIRLYSATGRSAVFSRDRRITRARSKEAGAIFENPVVAPMEIVACDRRIHTGDLRRDSHALDGVVACGSGGDRTRAFVAGSIFRP